MPTSVPAPRPLFLVVGIYDDLHRDPFLPFIVPLWRLRLLELCHRPSVSLAEMFRLLWRCLPPMMIQPVTDIEP